MSARFTALLGAIFAFSANAAAAQDNDGASTQPNLCFGGGASWQASIDETRNILLIPIPESFRSRFESTGTCVRWALNERAIVDWHVRFGNEQSIVPALEYLEQDYLESAPEPDRFMRELERGWRRALPDVRTALAMSQPQGLNYSVAGRFMNESDTISRFQRLIRMREDFLFVAEQYLVAAEEFRSADLLQRAETFLQPVLDGAEFLQNIGESGREGRFFASNLDRYRSDDLRLRSAVLRAQISEDPDDVARAQEVLDELERPNYSDALLWAYSGGEDFCDVDDHWVHRQQILDLCREEDNFQYSLTSFFVNRAILDLVQSTVMSNPMNPEQVVSTYSQAVELVEKEIHHEENRCCYQRADQDLWRLRRALADFRETQMEEPRFRTAGWHSALAALQSAQELAQPSDAPGRFKRIADRWLSIWDRRQRLIAMTDSEERLNLQPEMFRYAAFLSRTLVNLDLIVAGSEMNATSPPN